MKVMFAPFYSGNQYQELLSSALREEGVEVVGERWNIPFSPLLLQVISSRVDVLHVHWTHPYFLFGSKRELYSLPFSRLVCRVAAVVFLLQVWLASIVCERVVWTIHNRCNHEQRYEDLDQWVSRRLLRIVDGVQVWDGRTREAFEAYLNVSLPEVHEIAHGNYRPLYEGRTHSRAEARAEIGVEDCERVYLFFGMIRPYKQVPLLIERFQALDDDACLVVAGNPKFTDLRDEIEQLAAGDESVQLHLEYIPDDEVPLYFSAADAAVFPYRHIFNSGSVLLAMTLGLPFVAPRMGSIQSVSPPGNILYEDLDEGLERLSACSTADLESVGARNREAAVTNHDWTDIAAEHISMYRD
ncbi:glycosyltransferase [Haloarchaeobius sp. TZWSO28]|uniref:glycosyltransferase n=1 Tax=Haloarchaeobius sp. TZWSO28 TaxID=3446119 RepID=UPI003EBD768C